MKKLSIIYIVIIALVSLTTFVSAQETITLTTYYPSPFGVYQQLEVGDSLMIRPNATPPPCAAAADAGRLYVDNAAPPRLNYCDGLSGWTTSIGPWVHLGTDVYQQDLTWNVGIGTNSPDEILEVDGNIEIAGTARTIFMGRDTDAGPFGIDFFNTEADLMYDTVNNQLQFRDGTATPLFLIDADDGTGFFAGNVGIAQNLAVGQLTPAVAPLQVTGNTQLDGNLTFGANNPTVAATSGNFTLNVAAGSIALNPTTTFNVTSAGATFLSSGDVINNLSGATRFAVQNGGVDVFTVQRTGFVGIGTPTATVAGMEFEVVGDVAADSFIYRPSTIKAKENVRPVSGIEGIKKLRGVRYELKDNGKTEIGVIAEDIEAVYPELVVSDDQSEMKGVKYGNLVAPLIEAIKEQQEMIEEQQNQINELRSELELFKQSTF